MSSTRTIAASTAANGSGPASAVFPVDTLAAAAPHLRRPFTLHAVQFRILEGRDGTRANCAAYITARTAIDRLNHVCPQLWSDGYEAVPGGLRCDLTIDGVTRSDVGWSAGTGNAMTLKTLYSDAFKRAAVKFGVGVSLYALPQMILYASKGHLKVYERQGKPPRYFLTDSGTSELRSRYQQWLAVHGGEHFGDPLDHGHVEGSHDPEDVPDDPDATAVDDRAAGLPTERVEAIATLAKQLLDAKVIKTADVKTQLVAAGATNTSSVKAALSTLTAAAADQLERDLTVLRPA